MMMLAAVVLVVGFIALAGMIARVGELGTQTGREQQRALLLEVGPMKEGLDDAMARLLTEAGHSTATEEGKVRYEAAIEGVLAHMRLLEASRGFLMEYELRCATAGDPATGYVEVTIWDSELMMQVRSATFVRPAAASPC